LALSKRSRRRFLRDEFRRPEPIYMPRRPDAPDLAVDELKRRARRRLVGAIVLALAAAVILPLLLESDPKPLGDEVNIRIPPIDNGKFINPLAPDKGRESAAPGATDAKTEPKPGAVITPKKAVAEAERRVLGQSLGQAPPASKAANAPAVAATAAATTPGPAVVDTATPAPTPVLPTPVPTGADAPAAKADAPAATQPQAGAAGVAFAVQVGAFADTKVAADLAASLKASGYATYTEAVPTAQGSVQRVRVGPYATRGAADAAAAKLIAAGYDRALVTNAK
jgi:DedD protein